MASNFDGITLQFSETTKSKIAAYAVLSRQNVDAVIGQLEGLIDEALKEKCIALLGGEVQTWVPLAPVTGDEFARAHETVEKTAAAKAKPRKSFADAHKEAAAPPPVEEEAFAEIEEDDTHVPHHELSADEDTQDNKSLEEQIEEDENVDPEELEEIKRGLASARFKSVGKNAEAFLDNTLGEPEESDTDEIPSVTRGYAGNGPYGERPIKATKTFESRMRKGHRAKVSFHTGDED